MQLKSLAPNSIHENNEKCSDEHALENASLPSYSLLFLLEISDIALYLSFLDLRFWSGNFVARAQSVNLNTALTTSLHQLNRTHSKRLGCCGFFWQISSTSCRKDAALFNALVHQIIGFSVAFN